MKGNLKQYAHSLALATLMVGVLGGNSAVAKGQISDNTASAPVADAVIDGKSYSVVKTTIKASPDRVFQVLTDYENAHNVFPQVKKCEVLQDKGKVKIVKHVVTPSGPVGTYSYVLKIEETEPKLITWTRLSGSFKQVTGYYKLEPINGGRTTLVTYASHVDGGFLMPKPLIKRQSKIDMPSVMTHLKRQVEQKVQIAGKMI